MTKEEHLVWVQQRRVLLDEAREAWVDAIVEAQQDGVPLREIAEGAGVSHEQIRRIVSTDRPDS